MSSKSIFDYAIVGSGASGGRIALQLTKKGANCILLEAGTALNRDTFPRNEMDYTTAMFWGGGLEMSTDAKIGFLRGKTLGGTTVVNQALLDRFDEIAFSDWKERSGISFFTTKEMERFYSSVENSLRIETISPKNRNKNALYFSKALDKLGYFWSPLKRGQSNCRHDRNSDCIVCLGGCPRDSKQSSLITSIETAKKIGLTIQTKFEVDHIKSNGNEVRIIGLQEGQFKEVRSRKVVLAAGAIGTTKILLSTRSKTKLPALGSRFSCHPQYMTYALFDEPVDSHKGALQSVKSDDLKLRRSGYKFENVFAPPIGTAMIMPGLGSKHINRMKKYRHFASIEVCIRDEPIGKIKMKRNGKLKITKKLTRQDKKRIAEARQIVHELFESVEAKEIISSTQGFGLHLMGGCPIGTNSESSVVNPEFQLHSDKNIYVADSSIFPSAPGINPSLTIMALSEMAVEKIIKND